MPWGVKGPLEAQIKAALRGTGAAGYVTRLLRKLGAPQGSNKLINAARSLLSLDRTIAIYLLAMDDLMDGAVYDAAAQSDYAFRQGLADGSLQGWLLLLSSGALSPSGITDDDDGFAPITHCPSPR